MSIYQTIADSRLHLSWEESIQGWAPTWTTEPDEAIVGRLAHRHLNLTHEEIQESTTTFEFQGAFNKLYAINCPEGAFFMRVTLSVDPAYKTLSEVATITYVRDNTSITVPRIIASDSSCENELGFEYILMERVPGQSLNLIWPTLSWEQKTALVQEVAVVTAQMHELRFDQMGSLFAADDLTKGSEQQTDFPGTQDDPIVDRLVSMAFFWKTRFLLDVPRGPFRSEKEWLRVRLDLAEDDLKQILNDPATDEDDREEIEDVQKTLIRLHSHFDTFFPSGSDSDVFYLFHNDVSRKNIMVNSEGQLQALLDWECVSTCPRWKTHQFPQFLISQPREEKPDLDMYAEYEEDGSLNEVLIQHVTEYECTQLRRVFADKMDNLVKGWSSELESGQPKRDFEESIDNCDGGFGTQNVEVWLNRFEEGGEYVDLRRAWRLHMSM